MSSLGGFTLSALTYGLVAFRLEMIWVGERGPFPFFQSPMLGSAASRRQLCCAPGWAVYIARWGAGPPPGPAPAGSDTTVVCTGIGLPDSHVPPASL